MAENGEITFAGDIRSLYGGPLQLLSQCKPHEILSEPVLKPCARPLVINIVVIMFLPNLPLLFLFDLLLRLLSVRAPAIPTG